MASESTSKERIPLSTMRHSAAHVLAQALASKYAGVKLAIGPDTENGFFYDVLTEPPLRSEDLPEIEKKMKHIMKARQRFEQFELPIDQGIEVLRKEGQSYKVEMAQELKKEGEKSLSFYRNLQGAEKSAVFTDMCSGPHVEHTGQLGAFKLVSVSGAYWKGRTDEPQLQRVSGILFRTDEELRQHEAMVEEAKKRDHRRIGVDLELFTTSEKIGPGLILWLPRGNIIKEELESWAKETETKHGYQRVTTPVITKEDLFYTSEHLPHYKESMFPPMQVDNENYYIKPMNCPFHHTIFAMRPRSYRELPLRLAEYGVCHRYEDSGGLIGLMRVRSMTMNDAHIYCAEEDAVQEFLNVLKLHEYYYNTLGIEKYHMVLALRNPENTKYHGDEAMWKRAESMMREAMESSGIAYEVEQDGAAFYGPKVDFQITSSIGREFTASTCQLDLFMPEKFDLKYVDRDGTMKRPACLHRSPLGTHERFVGFLIEHFAGAFPLWLAPEQIRILPVSEGVHDACRLLQDRLTAAGLRATMDDGAETLGKRIRTAEKLKVPRMVVIGDQEKEKGLVNWRDYFTGEKHEVTIEDFVKDALAEVAEKRLRRITKAV